MSRLASYCQNLEEFEYTFGRAHWPRFPPSDSKESTNLTENLLPHAATLKRITYLKLVYDA
jgi:hypothetical protein